MRIYPDMESAILEIRRDLHKGSKVQSTRVQQWTEIKDFAGVERTNYSYGIQEGIPYTARDLVELGAKMDMPFYQQNGEALIAWLNQEAVQRIYGARVEEMPNEVHHPALEKTIEGSFPSYTYPEILNGAFGAMHDALKVSPDSRRAYWPMYQPHHALRAPHPTRVPCSLGYHAMIRRVPGKEKNQLIFTYLQRSADFDKFFLTDIWLARQFQIALARQFENTEPGIFAHYVISLHSFNFLGYEVY